MKLVKSLHSSFSQSYEEQGSLRRREKSPRDGDNDEQQGLRRAFSDETTHYSNCLDSVPFIMPTVEDLMDAKADRPRPRSCVDANASGFSLTDIASTMKKRWSGIQLGSKLFQAFDKLLVEDIASGEEEYTDSLENPKMPNRKHDRCSTSSNNSTSDDSNELTKDEHPPSLPEKTPRNSEKKDEKSDTAITATSEELSKQTMSSMKSASSMGCSGEETPTGGGKFKRLQMKWELLSGKDTRTTSGNNPRSKIPRLVTSPVRASAIPVPVHTNQSNTSNSTATPVGIPKAKKPFTSKNDQSSGIPSHRQIKSRSGSAGSKDNNKEAPSEDAGSNSVIARPQMVPKSAIYGAAAATRRQTRLSRADQEDSIDSTANRSVMGRSSSLGYRSLLSQHNKTARSGSAKSERRTPLNKQKQVHQNESQNKQR